MFATIIYDVKRYWHHKAQCLAWFIQAILMSGLIHIIYGDQSIEGVWLIVPVISYFSSDVYRCILNPQIIRLIHNGVHPEAHFIRNQFTIISVVFNSIMAWILSMLFNTSWLMFVVIWSVLDMLGGLLFCLQTLIAGSGHLTIVQLLVFPLAFPWLLFGMMIQHGEVLYLKPLMLMWCLFHAYGVLFYGYCNRISQSD